MKTKKSNLKKDFVLVLLPKETKVKIRKLAKAENRTMSNFVLNALDHYFKEVIRK